ncbi:MAG: hypothetical protein CMJ58_13970 [Planctomycetaceae bacterium]|nr:hypothetical protein [Planctomycetaceae bacterium]
MTIKTQYSSDLTDRQWQLIRNRLPKRSRRGRPPIDRRRVINAVLYVVRTGCQWRLLPSDFPNGSTVYGVFWRWRNDGVWQRIHDRLREHTRRAAGKRPKPTAAIIDSQSVRTAEGGEPRAYATDFLGRPTAGSYREVNPLTYWPAVSAVQPADRLGFAASFTRITPPRALVRCTSRPRQDLRSGVKAGSARAAATSRRRSAAS